MRQYQDASFALTVAYASAPSVIGWKSGGWIVYSPLDAAPHDIEPELLVLKLGHIPIPLSDIGCWVLASILTK